MDINNNNIKHSNFIEIISNSHVNANPFGSI